MSAQIFFLPYNPKRSGPPTAAELNAAVSLDGAFADLTVEFTRAADGMHMLRTATVVAANSFTIPFTMTRRDHRRMVTQWARIDRRPTLIHNGRKPR